MAPPMVASWIPSPSIWSAIGGDRAAAPAMTPCRFVAATIAATGLVLSMRGGRPQFQGDLLEDTGRQAEDELRLLHALRDSGVRSIALCADGLSPGSLAVIADIVRTYRAVEGSRKRRILRQTRRLSARDVTLAARHLLHHRHLPATAGTIAPFPPAPPHSPRESRPDLAS